MPKFLRSAMILAVICLMAPRMAHAADDIWTVLAAGDIGVCDSRGPVATAELLDRLDGVVLALGDLAYPRGTPEQFRNCYDPTWGRQKNRTYPVPGNHDYKTKDAAGYFDYWGSRAGESRVGYYSFDLGAWHLIALNSLLSDDAFQNQLTWLRNDLERSSHRCILAYWHHPVFSSGKHGYDRRMLPVFRTLHEAGASIVLAGHDHLYERFAPQDPTGTKDSQHGIRSFVVGTGGAKLYDFDDVLPNSEFRFNEDWGLLRLTLGHSGYAWEFLTTDGKSIDAGEEPCVARDQK